MFMTKLRIRFLSVALIAHAAACAAATLSPVPQPPGLKKMQTHFPGRALHTAAGDEYQWPGLYFEARFEGAAVDFEVGAGDVILRVLVDDQPVATLVKPAPGVYEIADLVPGRHTARVEALTESQAGPNVFGGFLYSKATRALPSRRRARQIEFIGDSHTVGYGNTAKSRDCTADEVWSNTDTSAAFGAKVARHYDADYQINAISGRGIVRNYDGSAGDPLPVAYPFVLLDHAARYAGRGWRPQVIVIALGTNDFSTSLHAGEKWTTRDALHEDYEATYAKFLDELRARNPGALFIVWATDMAEREIATEGAKVVEQRKARGDDLIEFMPVEGLEMTGCHWHPSVTDDDVIAAKLIRLIDGRTPWSPRS